MGDKIEPKFKVLITTSGLGSRLGEITDYTNKSLVVVGDKPALSYIIEKYPPSVTIVVTLGHYGEHVKQFLKITYPDRKFEFVLVDPYKGPKSSLAYSILQAKALLQQPFIFHASDSLVLSELIPEPNMNWVGGAKSTEATNYASFDVLGDRINKFHDKGMVQFDYLHIGLIGINDFKSFWKELEDLITKNLENSDLNDLSVLQSMLVSGINLQLLEFTTWLDIGNSHALINAQKLVTGSASVLRKPQESISFVNGKVVKFFFDGNVCSQRIKRAEDLAGLVPRVTGSSDNFYSYDFVEGETLSKSKDPTVVNSLLLWASENLWESRNEQSGQSFNENAYDFYNSKSLERISSFLSTRGLTDVKNIINDQEVPLLKDLIPKAVEIVMSELIQTRIHGDFILDNILLHNGNFMLIDWRQSFGKSLTSGDLYYDLAKLNHSFHINHDIVSRNLFEINQSGNDVTCSILYKDTLSNMRSDFQRWVENRGLNLQKVSVLTSLIWLNMAPLHHHPFDIFLFNYGKYNLFRSI